MPIQLKRGLPHYKAHASWNRLTSALPHTCTNNGWNYFITRSLLCSDVVEYITQSSADHLHTDLFNGSRNSSTHYCSEYWLTAPRRIFHIPMWKGIFSQWKKTILCEDGFLNHFYNHVITWLFIWPTKSFYAPTLLLPNAPQWNNCQYLPQSMFHNKTWPRMLARGFVTCSLLHGVAKSCNIVKFWCNELNK